MILRTLKPILSHLLAAGAGFAAGIYLLPILTAPPAPSESDVQRIADSAGFVGTFRRDLKDSDPLHWGEGTVSVSRAAVALQGQIAPGPDYRLYFSPEFVETEQDFERVKPRMVEAGDVKTFKNFVVPLKDSINPAQYNTVIVWCESFSQFITAAQYQPVSR